jgi:hypothetical protein
MNRLPYGVPKEKKEDWKNEIREGLGGPMPNINPVDVNNRSRFESNQMQFNNIDVIYKG